jgi:hypothetical protein
VTDDGDKRPKPNPFSTRFVRPGAMAYLFAPGESATGMARRLADLGWRAQIVGPHGSGKSTLLAELLPAVERAGRPAWLVTLRDGQRRLPRDWVSIARRAAAGVIVVDGYEQLSYWSRWRLKARCRRASWGLLVTAHRDAGLPTLASLVPSLQAAQAVVDRLLPQGSSRIDRAAVADCFAAAGGNIREMFFALYDRYQDRLHHRA